VGIESPVHLLFIGAVALLVLGPKRLPEVARALGKGLREFREAMGAQPTVGPTPAASAPTAARPEASASAATGSGGLYELDPALAVAASDPGAQLERPASVDPLEHAHVDPPQQVPSAGAPDRRPL
jgi:sec-independent protein translocase protein TatA